MKWIGVGKKLPEPDTLCLVCHYNNHREILRYDGCDWWEVSNRSEDALKVT